MKNPGKNTPQRCMADVIGIKKNAVKFASCIFLILSFFTPDHLNAASGDAFYSHTKRLYTITPWGHTRWGLEYLPDDFNTTTQKYPIIVYFHGTGETGSTEGSLSNLLYNGPSNFIAFSNYNMQFVNPNTGQVQKFIYIALQSAYWSPDINEVWYVLKNDPRLKDRISNIFYTGLSAGGQQTMMSVLTNQEMASGITAIVPMSSAGFDRTGIKFAKNSTVKSWCFHGLADNVCAWQITSDFNDSLGSSRSRWTQSPSIHGNWNLLYTSNYREVINGKAMNIYEWMLSTISAPVNPPPVALAGPDQVLNFPVVSTVLNGNGRGVNATITNYKWNKVSGPSQYAITNNTTQSANINNLAQGVYEFELIVTDSYGAEGRDTVVITENAGPLPVKLTLFALVQAQGSNLLKWRTSGELNSDYFSLERSNNGRVFTEIGRINAAGNSTAELNYSYSDIAPLPGINYYRLVSVDLDGRFEYSKIISTQVESSNVLKIVDARLSKSDQKINLLVNSGTNQAASLILVNESGAIIFRSSQVLQKGMNQIGHNIKYTAGGIYYVKILTPKWSDNKVLAANR